ncbi:dolichyl-P-Man:Man(5)GlcNAc(2)-PP-dolichol alpha-1,3-mannosyltransferase [Cadophora gregata]|uniref:dolichyl-P-Man:Man(5)GlcNAc(2)-PP-dolichol alpha-1,3-mannosyltransferase n=1 Tax=Cadophora gregata TaxID=51156 RepID=UPI0026DD4E7C|nr:dolichyl-P-Man:Man(5)GlcNAc(2)-PP-dolichol alpha-1,3-mannosyltransferase [Cadophora gregata]KAK0120358.1 dolichyl-P-Man:Man(5)GlcNAc(2)-PP-dolichol alpha-1,3-mannosyltransferase [Cadophora gregata]KAK0121387.1 dolichyl-P-Man:Man(5)GlcNAc(2)-PP-dolichol alpha-1,3-mannosyltransferase [Cadophora gregata f. sp. sojae]
MSKLSSSLKALIGASFARPNTLPATPRITSVYERLRQEASAKNVGTPAWLTLSTAATMTMNSPESLTELYNLATEKSKDKKKSVETAELMREVGLKCIGFNGVPRTINCLGAFRASLPSEIVSSLSTKPTRIASQSNIDDIITRGNSLWESIYRPFDEKLYAKLAESHPDLPVFILNHEYGALFADPPALGHESGAKVGRVLTSIVAVACLRAQTGVGPQVTSHVFGLRKAFEDESFKAKGEFAVEGGEWLATDEGNIWLLGAVDSVVEALGEGKGTSFAPGMVKSKL